VRVITAIDLWVYLFITQTLQMLIGRNVTIGIDACCLNDNAEAKDAGKLIL